MAISRANSIRPLCRALGGYGDILLLPNVSRLKFEQLKVYLDENRQRWRSIALFSAHICTEFAFNKASPSLLTSYWKIEEPYGHER